MSDLILKRTFFVSISIIVFVFIINAIYFGWTIHSSYIRADQWRFIELYLYPLYDNSFEFKMLWSDHHPEPLIASLFILSEKYFDLTVNLYFYVGIIGKAFFIILFLFLVNKSLKNVGLIFNLLVYVLIVSTFLSLKSINEYAWSLVTLGNFWLFILLVGAYYLSNIYKEINIKNSSLLLFILACLLVFSKDLAIIYIGSIIGTLLLVLFIDKRYGKFLEVMFIVLLSFLIYKIFYIYIDVEQKYTNSILFDINNFNIIGIIQSYSIGLLSGVLQIQFLKDIGFENTTILYIGYVILLLYVMVIIIYIKLRLYNISLIPIIFMLFTLVFITAVILYRFYPSADIINWVIASPRYTKLYEIGIISMFWAIAIIIKTALFNKILIKTIILMVSVLILINIYAIKTSWDFSKYVVNTNKKIEKELFSYVNGNDNKIPKFVRGGFFSEEKVEFLKKYKLNVFSDNYLKKDIK